MSWWLPGKSVVDDEGITLPMVDGVGRRAPTDRLFSTVCSTLDNYYCHALLLDLNIALDTE